MCLFSYGILFYFFSYGIVRAYLERYHTSHIMYKDNVAYNGKIRYSGPFVPDYSIVDIYGDDPSVYDGIAGIVSSGDDVLDHYVRRAPSHHADYANKHAGYYTNYHPNQHGNGTRKYRTPHPASIERTFADYRGNKHVWGSTPYGNGIVEDPGINVYKMDGYTVPALDADDQVLKKIMRSGTISNIGSVHRGTGKYSRTTGYYGIGDVLVPAIPRSDRLTIYDLYASRDLP